MSAHVTFIHIGQSKSSIDKNSAKWLCLIKIWQGKLSLLAGIQGKMERAHSGSEDIDKWGFGPARSVQDGNKAFGVLATPTCRQLFGTCI